MIYHGEARDLKIPKALRFTGETDLIIIEKARTTENMGNPQQKRLPQRKVVDFALSFFLL